MDFFSDHKSPKTHTEKKHESHDAAPSTTELLSSAKVVADAARASLNHDTDKLDRAKLADAAGDLLQAASHYGKLEENQSYGKYVQKAEDYLHDYKTTSTTTTSHTTTTNESGNPTTTTSHSITTTSVPMDSSHPSGGSGGDGHGHGHGHSSGGSGGDGHGQGHSEGGGYGEYFKMAEGFLKKH